MLDVAIITINYNSTDETVACIESIIKQTSASVNYKIVVIDNASEPLEFLRLQTAISHDRVTIKRSKKNLGFLPIRQNTTFSLITIPYY